MKNVEIILFLLVSLVFSAQPPKIKKMNQITPNQPTIMKNKKTHLGLIRKRFLASTTTIENSKLTVNFEDNSSTLEHQITIVANDLEERKSISNWSFNTSSKGIEVISNTCEIQVKSTGSKTDKTCTATHKTADDLINFSYDFQLENIDQLVITYKYKETPEQKKILYKAEPIAIPLFNGAVNCDYKYVIPDKFVNLGLENNALTKESDLVYIFKGACPSERLDDVIRFSHKEVSWDADTKINIKAIEKFSGNVKFLFPRYYQGGKLTNDNYKITDQDNVNYDTTESIDNNDETKFNITLPASDKNELGVELSTSFTNKLNDEFKVDLPEKYYAIDLSVIPKEIQDKAKEIQSEQSDFPDYYKLGKFVNEYMTYDASYTNKAMTLDQIFTEKRGVCEHYTLLYNAMLNTIGIKTLFASGWAFNGEQTSGDKDTIGHAWTLALIDGKWKELDSTWGLLEGLSAGHIFKNFNQDKYSFNFYTPDANPNVEHIPTIKMNKTIESTNIITETTNKIVETTNKITEPTNKKVELTNKIIENTNKKVEPTNKIIETTNKIVEPTNKIIETTNKIVEPTNKIIETTNKIVESTYNNNGRNNNNNNNNNNDNKSDTTQTKTDEQDNDDIEIIRTSEGYSLKYSLILLIILFLY